MGANAGAVTFLFTDVEGSTRWWEDNPEEMGPALRLHDAVIRTAVETNSGEVFATGGDGFAVVFGDPSDALRAASAAQEALAAADWGQAVRLAVRMGIHSGLAEARGGDYFGPTLNRAARLMSVGHGGQVLVSEATSGLLDSGEWTLIDLGRHRLKDVTRPQRVFQLGDRVFPQLRSIQGAVGNLPRERSSFIGRGRLLDEVAGTLEKDPVVTLTGVGGVGKTRIAIEVARRFAETAGDGAWLCPLAEANDGESVVDVINLALGVRPTAERSGSDALIDWLSSRELLLVLDNCEHVIDDVAELIEDMLDAAAQVKILVTSREGLAMPGERLVAVPALGLPNPESPGGSESVELFVARASKVRSDFDADVAAVTMAEICRRLDGMPLAIELAAVRVETMSVDDILANLDQRFEFLTGGRGRRRERHQTLRHTVRWSYDLLDEAEQAVFRRLSVFAASFALDAAVMIGATFAMSNLEIVDTLASLCRKSLVQIEDDDGTIRYRYLETMRAFAEELNEEAEEVDEAMAALTAWFIEWAEQFPALYRRCRIGEAAAKVDTEEQNLRRVLNWASNRNDPATVAKFFAPFGLFLYWGADRLAPLAAEYVDLPGIDDSPGADSILALAAFDAYEHIDLERGRVLTERGFAAAARVGETAFACELARWILEFILGGDVSVRSRPERALADAVAKDLDLVTALFEVNLVAHDAIVGSLELMESGSAVVRQRAIELDAPILEMVTEVFCGMGEKHRDLDRALVHLERAAELDGMSRQFFGIVIREELAAHAILTDDDERATILGAQIARHAATAGRKNWFVIAGAILTGPVLRSGDGEAAASLAGWASASPLFTNFWPAEIAHIVARCEAALPPERFDEAFTAGQQAPFDDMADRIIDQLATIEALRLR